MPRFHKSRSAKRCSLHVAIAYTRKGMTERRLLCSYIWHPKYNIADIAIKVTGYIEVTKQYGRHKIWSGKTGNEAMTQSLVVLK